jgi:phage terminase large subunit|tara:strand:- start:2292 stop:3341 length:1050 start_codon:yes stop_codon:yes gene_type:complete
LLWIIFSYCHKNKGKVISVCRKTLPSLKASTSRDFLEILRNNELYSEIYHNKTSNEYWLNGNLIEFFSLDMGSRVRGRKRDLLFVNEANEIDYEAWNQLLFRTDGNIIIDYNPHDQFHWIYDKVLVRPDCNLHISTYKDNPFLSNTLKEEIQRLKDTDPDYWRVYGLGLRGKNRSLVFKFEVVDRIPEDAKLLSYGLDFGFASDPSSLCVTYVDGLNMYSREILYKKGLTNQDLALEFERLGLDRRDEIFADSSEPKSIEEIYRMGWNIKGKKKFEINYGIDLIRRYKLHVTKDSKNAIKELESYKYIEDKNGNPTNKPLDANNHFCDSLRYSVVHKLGRANFGKYAIK